MKTKFKTLLPLALFSLVLTGCANKDALPMVIDEDKLTIDTPWEDFVIPPTSIKFANSEVNKTLTRGETYTYADPSIQPSMSNANKNNLTWVSSDESVATVNAGIVTAVGAGTATINAKFKDVKSNDLSVTVYNELNDFSLKYNGSVLTQGQTIEVDYNTDYVVSAVFDPIDTSYRDLVWSVEEGKEDLLTLNNGNIRTNNVDGLVEISVYSERLGIASTKTFKVDIADRTIHLTSINAELAGANEIEVGKSGQINGHIEPSNATHPELTWHSSNEAVATVSYNGLINAVDEGTAEIYATGENGAIESNHVVVNVFEVKVAAINLNESTISLTNEGSGSLTKKLEFTYTTDKAGYEVATKAQFVYSSDDTTKVTIDENGNMIGVGVGSTTVRVTETRTNLVAIANVNVNIVVESVRMVASKTSMELGSSYTFSAVIEPAGAPGVVTWTSTDDEVVSIDNATGLAVANKVGTATITAICGTKSAAVEVTVSKTPQVFLASNVYLVGNRDYSSRNSQPGSSWGDATYALKFDSPYQEWNGDHSTSWNVYKAEKVYFHEGDMWKIRHDAEGWIDVDKLSDDGSYIINWYEDSAGGNNVFAKGQMSKVDVPQEDGGTVKNIQVDVEGYYNMYVKKDYSDNALYMSVYVEKAPELSIERTAVTVAVNGTATNKISNWDTSYNKSFSVEGKATVVIDQNGNMTISGVSEGSTKLTIVDVSGHEVSCMITVVPEGTVVANMVYLNANGQFDSDSAVPFLYAYTYGTENYKSYKMSKVAGQNIVYSAEVAPEYNTFIFVRMPAGSSELIWEDSWNQTEDITFQDDHNMWTMGGYNEALCYGVTSVFDPSIVYEVNITPTPISTFEEGVPYIVGNRDYHSGTSTGSTGGWGNDASKAYKTIPANDDLPSGVMAQYKATLTLKADDLFKVVIGGTTLFWDCSYETDQGGLKNGDVEIGSDTNVKVVTPGVYDIYVKCYTNGGGWSVYISEAGDAPLPPTPPTPESEWEANIPYVVGNRDYHTGTSTGTSGGWGEDISKAYKTIEHNDDLPDHAIVQYKAELNLTEGDEFKVVIGGEELFWDVNYETGEGGLKNGDVEINASTNIEVVTTGAYDVYVKCLDNNGGWWVYISEASVEPGPTPPEPGPTWETNIPYVIGNRDYSTGTSTGTSGGWGEDISKALKATLHNEDKPEGCDVQYKATLNLTDGDEFKVVIGGTTLNWDLSYEDNEYTGFSNRDVEWNTATNVEVNTTGQYDIYVKRMDSTHGDNWYVFISKATVEPGPTPPTPTPTWENVAYVVGNRDYSTGTSTGTGAWGDDVSKAFKTTQHLDDLPPGCIDQYKATLTLAVGDELKVVIGGNSLYWVPDANYENDGAFKKSQITWVAGTDGSNPTVQTAGEYDIYVKCMDSTSGDGWYVYISEVKGGDTPTPPGPTPTESNYSLVGTFNNWTVGQNKLLNTDDDNHYTLTGVVLMEGSKIKVTDGTAWYGNESPWSGCGFEVDTEGNVVLSQGGTYTIDFYIDCLGGNHISITKTAEDTNTSMMITVYDLPDWLKNNNCVIYAWVTTNNTGGSWVAVTINGTIGTFVCAKTITHFRLSRSVPGRAPSWTQQGSDPGRIYNATSTFALNGSHVYQANNWPGYNP